MNRKIKNMLEVLMMTDVYKTAHRSLYPSKLEVVFSNFTPRSGDYLPGVEKVIATGMRYVINNIRDEFVELFGNSSKYNDEIIKRYTIGIKRILGIEEFDAEHIRALMVYIQKHKDLPLEFRAVKENTAVDFKVPLLTINNTDKRFAWLVNYLETWISAELWPIITASTKALEIKKKLLHYAKETGVDESFVDYQAHDFSFRGMMGKGAAKLVGMGHLTHFIGSDNLPAILEMCKGASVIATEHSIMSSGTKDGEFETYKRLIEDNPEGILSLVSDTWDIYKVLDEILPKLKNEITNRKGSLVIRPDSGEPITQLLGDSDSDKALWKLGLFKLIEKHFGFSINERGYKVLPITFLWGEGMTLDTIDKVYSMMKLWGYASSNLVIGVGSYMYQYNTRDTLGFAMKATYMEIDGKAVEITKDPITSDGFKTSAKGLLVVNKGKLIQQATWEQVNSEDNELLIIKKIN